MGTPTRATSKEKIGVIFSVVAVVSSHGNFEAQIMGTPAVPLEAFFYHLAISGRVPICRFSGRYLFTCGALLEPGRKGVHAETLIDLAKPSTTTERKLLASSGESTFSALMAKLSVEDASMLMTVRGVEVQLHREEATKGKVAALRVPSRHLNAAARYAVGAHSLANGWMEVRLRVAGPEANVCATKLLQMQDRGKSIRLYRLAHRLYIGTVTPADPSKGVLLEDCLNSQNDMRAILKIQVRLGATLANLGHPEDAIRVYRKALDLCRTFTRAIYNLGVSYLNIGCYHKAAEHLLAALQGQMTREEMVQNRKGKGGDANLGRANLGDGSDNLWHTLRRAFLCMVRYGGVLSALVVALLVCRDSR